LPWLNYLLVNAPDEYYGGYSWYDFTGDINSGVTRSRKLLFSLLEEQPEKGFPSTQTFLGGFSQGCLMSVEVGLRYPERLAGILGISGYVCDPEQLIKELSPWRSNSDCFSRMALWIPSSRLLLCARRLIC